jgi:hypothetical protein
MASGKVRNGAKPCSTGGFREPTGREREPPTRTAFLFNVVTEALKGGGLIGLPRRTQALHGLLDLACGLTLPAVVPLPAELPPDEPL